MKPLSPQGVAVHHCWRTKPRHGGVEIVTFVLEYPRYIHSEVLTHRMFSRNSSSSRAIPVEKMASKVEASDWVPPFAKNKKGMQAGESFEGEQLLRAQAYWKMAKADAVKHARQLAKLETHKQWANRVLEPFSTISTVLTMTEDQWPHFFALRAHEDAEPTFHELALAMHQAREETPVRESSLHLPFITDEERYGGAPDSLLMMASSARCARVSYNNHLGALPTWQEDLDLFGRLWDRDPPHASPLEHPATAPVVGDGGKADNYLGWRSFRYTMTHHSRQVDRRYLAEVARDLDKARS